MADQLLTRLQHFHTPVDAIHAAVLALEVQLRVCVYADVCVCMQMCLYVCMCICACTCVCVCVYVCV